MINIHPNWERISQAVVITSMTGVACYFGLNKLEDHFNGQTLSAPVIEQGATTYTLMNDTVVLRESNGMYLAFDFAARHIIIKGTVNDEKFTGYSTFEGYGRPDEIAAATKGGCDVARAWAERAGNFDPGHLALLNEDNKIEQAKTTANTFIRNYCQP